MYKSEIGDQVASSNIFQDERASNKNPFHFLSGQPMPPKSEDHFIHHFENFFESKSIVVKKSCLKDLINDSSFNQQENNNILSNCYYSKKLLSSDYLIRLYKIYTDQILDEMVVLISQLFQNLSSIYQYAEYFIKNLSNEEKHRHFVDDVLFYIEENVRSHDRNHSSNQYMLGVLSNCFSISGFSIHDYPYIILKLNELFLMHYEHNQSQDEEYLDPVVKEVFKLFSIYLFNSSPITESSQQQNIIKTIQKAVFNPFFIHQPELQEFILFNLFYLLDRHFIQPQEIIQQQNLFIFLQRNVYTQSIYVLNIFRLILEQNPSLLSNQNAPIEPCFQIVTKPDAKDLERSLCLAFIRNWIEHEKELIIPDCFNLGELIWTTYSQYSKSPVTLKKYILLFNATILKKNPQLVADNYNINQLVNDIGNFISSDDDEQFLLEMLNAFINIKHYADLHNLILDEESIQECSIIETFLDAFDSNSLPNDIKPSFLSLFGLTNLIH